uniref:Inhibitor I9 domain-containing protein n=1 Tax=Oryza meridionalis TaxID=40149 RepID=A0A0E0CCL1_9ORYZ
MTSVGVVLVALCATILIISIPTTFAQSSNVGNHESPLHHHHHPRALPAAGHGDASSGAEPEPECMYFVLLKPRADARMMDDGELRSWHMSFLPGDTTASGKRRLVHSYQHVLDGFAAWLKEAELEAVSIKPGFSKPIPDEPMYLGVMPDRTGVGGVGHRLRQWGHHRSDRHRDQFACNNKVIGARSHC